MSEATPKRNKPSPVILGAGVLILFLAVFVYFSPRVVSDGAVKSLCREETARQMAKLNGDFFIDSWRQDGLSAQFVIFAQGVKVRAECFVSGDARHPDVIVRATE